MTLKDLTAKITSTWSDALTWAQHNLVISLIVATGAVMLIIWMVR